MAGNNIRSWAKAMLDWAEDRGFNTEHYTDTHTDTRLPGGHLYINSASKTGWKVYTFPDGSLDQDHIVVDEPAAPQIRVRRGPIGKLTDVHYSPAASDAQKLADASRDIADLIPDGLLRHDFLGRFIGDEVL